MAGLQGTLYHNSKRMLGNSVGIYSGFYLRVYGGGLLGSRPVARLERARGFRFLVKGWPFAAR